MKKFIAALLVLVMLVTIIPTTALASDQPSGWAQGYVTDANNRGLVPSHLMSRFTDSITRAEFTHLAVALYETTTGTEIMGRETFTDTDDVNVQKMAYLGVVQGVGGGRFSPDGLLTREQAAAMLSRLFDALGESLPQSTPTFYDNNLISTWAVGYVGQMQATGIMGGVGNNRFDPHGRYTIEQSITTMLRVDDAVNLIDDFTSVVNYRMSNYMYNPDRFRWLLDAGFTVSNEIAPGIRLINFIEEPNLPVEPSAPLSSGVIQHSTNSDAPTQTGDVIVRGDGMEILIDIGSTIERLTEAGIGIPDWADETHRAVHRVGSVNWGAAQPDGRGWHQRFLDAFVDREYTILPQVHNALAIIWSWDAPIEFRHVQLAEPLGDDYGQLAYAFGYGYGVGGWLDGTNTQRGDVILIRYHQHFSSSIILIDTGNVDPQRPGARWFAGVLVHHYVWDW